MKKNPTQFPCTPTAEAMIIGRYDYSGFGMYVKLLQVIYKLPDRCLPKDNVAHVINSNGMDTFTVESLLENTSLFISDATRYFPVEANLVRRKEKPAETQIIPQHELQIAIIERYPNISKLNRQLSAEECEKLVDKYPKLLIKEKLMAMENRKTLTKDYDSVYLTLNNWCRMAMKDGWQEKTFAAAPIRATGAPQRAAV